MNNTQANTLRIIFPQWQGGNNPPYYLGAQLLAWLAPEANGPVEQVSVAPPTDAPLENENGVVGRQVLLRQARHARALIEKHTPSRLVILGGDCLVDLVPFSYLSSLYRNDLAVLWVDAHPDIMTPEQFHHAHAMVLGNLLGYGDPDFVDMVPHPISQDNVLLIGLNEPTPWEAQRIEELGISHVGPKEITALGSRPVLDWLKSTGARQLAIHFDLDVLDPMLFRALLFAKPNIPDDTFDGIAQGKLAINQIVELLGAVASQIDVVGLGIAEHLPWDALALKTMLEKLPLIGSSARS